MLTSRISRILIVAACVVIARRLSAQVRGTVVDPANAPVAGVSIFLTDSLGHVAGRALSDDQGAFRIGNVTPGGYRLRTLRIGYLPTTEAFFNVVAGLESVQRITLNGAPVHLDTIRVLATARCSAAQDSTGETFVVWNQARAALNATQLTASDRKLYATMVGYERYFDAEHRIMSGQRVRVHSDSMTTPWVEPSADTLHRYGYVLTDRETNEITYEVPGISTLLSPLFVDDHCFRLAADSADATRIGLTFEPTLERRETPEVKGTLWFDRQSSELRSLVYEYANVPAKLFNSARGAMSFAHAKNGSWIISGWNIRMPEVGGSLRGSGRNVYVSDPHITGTKETGGEVAMMKTNGDTAWAHPPVRFVVVVLDSLSGKPISGATVALEEADLQAVSDISGRATLEGIPIGNYTVYARTAELEEFGVTTRMRLSVIDSETTIGFRIPSTERLRAAGGALAGSVVSKKDSTPVIGAEVVIVDLSMATRTDGKGNFGIEHVPPGEHEVQFRRIGYAPASAKIRFSGNRLMNRNAILDPVVVLDSVITTESETFRAVAMFEEHRRLGLGKFLTRDSLARFDGRGLVDALSEIGSIDAASLHKRHAYAATLRKGYPCLSQVYLDHMLVYRGGSSSQPPFDLNTILAEQVEAIEFYPSAAVTPLDFSDFQANCGALVIWTRRSP